MKKPKKCINGGLHSYQIIRKTGKQTGAPTWKCIKCNNLVKST